MMRNSANVWQAVPIWRKSLVGRGEVRSCQSWVELTVGTKESVKPEQRKAWSFDDGRTRPTESRKNGYCTNQQAVDDNGQKRQSSSAHPNSTMLQKAQDAIKDGVSRGAQSTLLTVNNACRTVMHYVWTSSAPKLPSQYVDRLWRKSA